VGSAASLRPERPDDAAFLLALYASTREEELAAAPWTVEQKTAFLMQQFAAQRAAWPRQFPTATFDVIEHEGRPIGRLYVDRRGDDVRIVDISLLPSHRGGGIGGTLLRRVIADADRSGSSVSLHVEKGNPARRLYERLGFRERADEGVYFLMERPFCPK
jgi:ribosomal protein S18 acetylase RimI-like enzyme